MGLGNLDSGTEILDRPFEPSSIAGMGCLKVLDLAAKGLTTQQIAERLFISPNTADHHTQHVYGKIGVSMRAAAGPVGEAERSRSRKTGESRHESTLHDRPVAVRGNRENLDLVLGPRQQELRRNIETRDRS